MELRRAITEVWRPKGDQSLPAHGPDESSYDELSTTEGGTVPPTDGAAPMENDKLSTTKEGTPARETLVNKHATRERLNHGNSPVAIPAPGLHPKNEEPGAEPAENNQPRPPTPPVALPNPTSNPHDEPLEEAFEAFLKECNIANRNLYTRVILDHREIRDWSHFLLSSERNLCFIGLKDGPARSLCQGAKARQAAQNVTSFE
ncbi:hypothetical protein PCASD_21642 [Puccinia coronata f. sp. avenae]|uniref:Uncharacterized protein n=1 Tax=Puccinia coronata f. sp. avenae TaxID=200324 RepID=A0A2N5SBI0_9BASI|nr:hypothetical protein PCASD_21642 [Puccinia coronata f. sp. avenae]